MTLHYQDESVTLHHGDALAALRELPDQSVDCCVSSPPYFGLRDYGIEGQYGLEKSPAEYVETMRGLFAEVRRVLVDDGTLWLNIGDSYYSGRGNPGPNSADEKQAARRGWVRPQDRCGVEWSSPKNLLGIPWRVAFALQDDGWILRNAIIWHKPNAMPESVTDRLSTRYEQVFLFSKKPRYWFDLDPIKVETTMRAAGNTNENRQRQSSALGTEFSGGRRAGGNPGSTLLEVHETRNPGDVWSIPTQGFPEAHFATMPVTLAERCIQAGCKPGGIVLDPFSGSGTTGLAAARHGRRYVGIDLNAEYLDLSLRTRLAQAGLPFGEVSA